MTTTTTTRRRKRSSRGRTFLPAPTLAFVVAASALTAAVAASARAATPRTTTGRGGAADAAFATARRRRAPPLLLPLGRLELRPLSASVMETGDGGGGGGDPPSTAEGDDDPWRGLDGSAAATTASAAAVVGPPPVATEARPGRRTAAGGGAVVVVSDDDAGGGDRRAVEARAPSSVDASSSRSNARVGTTEEEETEQERLLAKILSSCSSEADRDLASKAYRFAEAAHRGQIRKSGEPYIVHPLSVALIIASDLKLDASSVATGLLHDTVEDCDGVTLQTIEREFGSEIARLVDGVTKIGRIQFRSTEERQAENYRKMIVAMSEDIRVILVKLADRLHNVRTLRHLPTEKQRKVARETLDVYAPLAHRLGIHWIKTELEDSSLKYLHPEAYERLNAQVAATEQARRETADRVARILKDRLSEAGSGLENAIVSGRAKSVYSIYRKMQTKQLGFDDVQDLTAFRVIVDDVGQCYQALGAVHALWKPVPGRFKDYVALPKDNGYRSLHTTVIGPDGDRIEVQIRTKFMHEVAEGGIAAHWMYKGGDSGGSGSGGTDAERDARRFAWLRQLVEWVQDLNDPQEFLHSVKDDLSSEEVFAFSPKGQLFALAKGATVLDFAYRVHSDLGDQCSGAKVNGRMVPLRHELRNGDTAEIMTSAGQTPQREWLDILKTSRAKTRVRSFLKRRQREESVALGREMLDRELKRRRRDRAGDGKSGGGHKKRLNRALSKFDVNDEEHLLAAVGYGRIEPKAVAEAMLGTASTSSSGKGNDDETTGHSKGEESNDEPLFRTTRDRPSSKPRSASGGEGILVGGKRNVLVTFCNHCVPLRGEDVKGVTSRGLGVKVHRSDCRYLLESDEERRIDAVWDDGDAAAGGAPSRPVQLEVTCEDSPGILADMSRAISSCGVNIGGVELRKTPNGRGLARFEVMLSSAEELERVCLQLRRESGVISAERK